MSKQVYKGTRAIADYLRPDAENHTPLVELPPELNPYYEEYGVHIYVKLLNTLPLANVKSLPAWSMLDNAQQDLEGMSVVESSSGNTVFSLGILAKSFGIQKVKAVASRDVTRGKLDLLRVAGIDIQLVDGPICPSPNDPKSSITIARNIGETSGWHNPGQYDNDYNPQAHRDYTGPQIYAQLDGEIGMFVAGLGTTGTLVGTSDYLRKVAKDIQVIGIVRAPNNAVPGVRTKNGLSEVEFTWKDNVTDGLVVVNEREAYENGLAMIRQGLLVGPSTGFALAGVLKQLDAMKRNGTLESMRDKNVVFVAPDSMFPYVDEYLMILEPSCFGEIDDQTTTSPFREASHEIANVAELSVEDVYNDYAAVGEDLLSQHYKLVDVREEAEYEDHHLPDSINVPLESLEQWLAGEAIARPLVFVCRRGATSLRAVQIAKRQDLEAYSMLGGTTEWSAKELPRILPNYC